MTISSAKSDPSAKSAIPYVIIGAFVLFALYIGAMVQQAMRTDVQLVSADYYQQELGYQQRITAEARTAALATPVAITERDQQLLIQFPPSFAGQAIVGEVRFFRPSDSGLDFAVPLHINTAADRNQTLNMAQLKAGHWRLQLDFTANGQRYFIEKVISR